MEKNSRDSIFRVEYHSPEFDAEIHIADIVERKCIYFLCNEEEIVYIGQTKHIHERIRKHRTDKKFDVVRYFYPPQDQDIRQLEVDLINWHTPRYNKMYD